MCDAAACCLNAHYIISPYILKFWEEKARHWGPIISGALFGSAWWIWADAVAMTDKSVPFDHWIPGIMACLAILMINVIRREDIEAADPFDDASYCRSRFWLFLSYIVSFGSIVAAVWVLLAHYAGDDELSSSEKWPGVAGILQVSFTLGSGLLFFLARTPTDDGGYGGYSSF